jgi:protease IV
MRELLAHVQFRGTIRERSVEPFLQLFRILRTKRRIKGVLFDISSGGGGSVSSSDLYLGLKRLDAVKPVVASIGGLAASGGYLAALGARKVYAYPESGVGSIGVIYPHLAVRTLLEKVGVEVELIHQGKHKDAFQGLRPLTDEERAKVQAVTDQNYRSFVSVVARERKKSVEQILPLATGEFWSGEQALGLGLVDALGDRETALEDLGRMTGVSPRKAVIVSPRKPFFERLMTSVASPLIPGLARSVTESIEDTVLGAFYRDRL